MPSALEAPTPILDVLLDAPTQPIDFAIVAAAFDQEWLIEAQTLETVLEAKGYARTVRVVREGLMCRPQRSHIDDVLVPFFVAESDDRTLIRGAHRALVHLKVDPTTMHQRDKCHDHRPRGTSG